MTLIKLTEYINHKGELRERPVLLNPEGIGTVAQDDMDPKESEIPLIGMNHERTPMSLITMRNNQKLAVKESLEEIASKCNDTGN